MGIIPQCPQFSYKAWLEHPSAESLGCRLVFSRSRTPRRSTDSLYRTQTAGQHQSEEFTVCGYLPLSQEQCEWPRNGSVGISRRCAWSEDPLHTRQCARLLWEPQVMTNTIFRVTAKWDQLSSTLITFSLAAVPWILDWTFTSDRRHSPVSSLTRLGKEAGEGGCRIPPCGASPAASPARGSRKLWKHSGSHWPHSVASWWSKPWCWPYAQSMITGNHQWVFQEKQEKSRNPTRPDQLEAPYSLRNVQLILHFDFLFWCDLHTSKRNLKD